MTKLWIALGIGTLSATTALAQEGDPEAGERLFNRCQACHVIESPDGETIAGRGQTGPNLYGVAGRQAGSVEDFANYSDALVTAGEQGLAWDQESFVSYVQDPTGYLREYLDDTSARSNMSFRVRSEEDARDLFAFLSQHGSEEGTEGTTE